MTKKPISNDRDTGHSESMRANAMQRPSFTIDEEYLIRSIRSSIPGGMNNSFMWGYLLGGMLMAGFGAFHQSIAMLICSFALVCVFRIGEERFQAKHMPHWKSIFDKYEAAFQAQTESNSPS